MTMRKSTDWMKQIDERMLEHLQKKPSSTPSLMASIRWIAGSKEMVRKRCDRLCQVGLVRQIAEATFEITTKGVLYLHGEVPAESKQQTAGYIMVHSADGDTTERMIEAFEPTKTFGSDSDVAKIVSNLASKEVIGGFDECVIHVQ